VIQSNLRERLFIGGRWTEPAGDQWIVAINPATEEPSGRVRAGTEADMDSAVAAARKAFDEGPWPKMAPIERAEIVKKAAEFLRRYSEEMAVTLTSEMGSPITQSRLVQIPRAIDLWEYYATLGSSYAWKQRRTAYDSLNQDFELLITSEPVGVVAAIVPWNGPQIVAAMKLAPALVAGCTAVLKPSEEASLTFTEFAEAFRKAGLPDGVLNIVPADRVVSEYLVKHPGVDKVSLTGSTAAGRRVGELCGYGLKRFTLELGGKSAAILLEDVDLPKALMTLAPAMAFINGQACNAPTRLLIPRSRLRELTDGIIDAVDKMPFGDPMNPDTFVGPLASKRQRDRVAAYLELGKQGGATVALGGGRPAGYPRGWYVEKTVFTGVDNAMRIAQEEIFGPVYCVIPYADEAEAISIANDSPYGLAGSVWTSRPEHGVKVASQIRCGALGVNSHTLDMAAPFGGCKQSGIGRECGPEGLDAYIETRSMTVPKGALT
jgi:aldehyde dehydrogenase (NAD+)